MLTKKGHFKFSGDAFVCQIQTEGYSGHWLV